MSNDTPQPMSVEEILQAYRNYVVESVTLQPTSVKFMKWNEAQAITALNELRRADMMAVSPTGLTWNEKMRLINERLRSEDLSPNPQQQ